MNVRFLLLSEPPPKRGNLQEMGEVTAGQWEVATLGSRSLSCGTPRKPRATENTGREGTHQSARPSRRASPRVSRGLPSQGVPRAAPLPAARLRSAPGGAAPGTCSAPAGQGRARETGGCPGTRGPGTHPPRTSGTANPDAAPLRSGAPYR